MCAGTYLTQLRVPVDSSPGLLLAVASARGWELRTDTQSDGCCLVVLQGTTSAGPVYAWPCSTSGSVHTAGRSCRRPAVSHTRVACFDVVKSTHRQRHADKPKYKFTTPSNRSPLSSQSTACALPGGALIKPHCTALHLLLRASLHLRRVAAQDQHGAVEHDPAPVPTARSRGPTANTPRGNAASSRRPSSSCSGRQQQGSCGRLAGLARLARRGNQGDAGVVAAAPYGRCCDSRDWLQERHGRSSQAAVQATKVSLLRSHLCPSAQRHTDPSVSTSSRSRREQRQSVLRACMRTNTNTDSVCRFVPCWCWCRCAQAPAALTAAAAAAGAGV